MVEHRTGIVEVMGSNPVEALIFFFRLLYSNCLNWKFTAKITYHLNIYPQFTYESFHIHYINVNSDSIFKLINYVLIQIYTLTVVSGFSSFLEDLLIDSGITSIVPVHPTSRRSKAYSKTSDSCFVP